MPDVGFTPIEQPKKVADEKAIQQALEGQTKKRQAEGEVNKQLVGQEQAAIAQKQPPTTPSILDVTRADKSASIDKAIAEDPALTFSAIAEKTGQETPLPPEPPAASPVVELPPVGKKAPAVTVQPSVQEMMKKLSMSGGAGPASLNRGPANADVKTIAAEAVKNPSFADMLRKIGFNVANIVQSAAYGATGNQKATIGDVAEAQGFEMKKAKAQAQIAEQMNAIEQKDMLDRIQAQAKYQAATNKELAAIDLQNDLVKIEAEKKARIAEIQAGAGVQGKGDGSQAQRMNKSLDIFRGGG